MVKGIKMQVYVGIGGDPLWAMGPAFVGMQRDNERSDKASAAKAYEARGRRARDMSSSWETIPSPKAYRALRPGATTLRAPIEPPQLTAAGQPPGGLLAQLINWLKS